jgi:hypothetical protein
VRAISDIRRLNLQALVDEAGGQQALATKIERDRNQVWQWLLAEGSPGARNLSHQTAREIERKCARPEGWLDQQHPANRIGETSSPSYSSQSTRFDPEIILESHKLLREAYASANRTYDIEAEPDLFAMVLQVAMERGLQGSNLVELGIYIGSRIKGTDGDSEKFESKRTGETDRPTDQRRTGGRKA